MNKKIARELKVLANIIIAKTPPTIFNKFIMEIKDGIKDLLKERMLAGVEKLKTMVIDDLTNNGYKVVSIDSGVGNFRGHPYISSFKIKIEKSGLKEPEKLVEYLQKYSTKFKFKGEKDGFYEFNTR